MIHKEKVLELLKNNNGILKASIAKEAGVTYATLKSLSKIGLIKKVSHGLYIDPDGKADKYFIAQHRCKKGIFSHETALFFHGLTDTESLRMMFTIPKNSSTRLSKEKRRFKIFYSPKPLHSLGKMMMSSPLGHMIYVYNKERTICDCLIKKEHLNLIKIDKAIKRYFEKGSIDYNKLLKYAERLDVKDLVERYIEFYE